MKYLQPSFMERIKGVEPSFQAWEAGVLPMNHIRMFFCFQVLSNTQYRYQIALNGTHFPLKSRCKVKYYIFLTMCYVRIIIIKHFGV